jgi:hypothetical protein
MQTNAQASITATCVVADMYPSADESLVMETVTHQRITIKGKVMVTIKIINTEEITKIKSLETTKATIKVIKIRITKIRIMVRDHKDKVTRLTVKEKVPDKIKVTMVVSSTRGKALETPIGSLPHWRVETIIDGEARSGVCHLLALGHIPHIPLLKLLLPKLHRKVMLTRSLTESYMLKLSKPRQASLLFQGGWAVAMQQLKFSRFLSCVTPTLPKKMD